MDLFSYLKNFSIPFNKGENFAFPFTIVVDTDNLVLQAAKEELAKDNLTWREPYRAAAYCLENKVSMADGKMWIDKSLEIEKNYWNTTLKAKYLAEDGNYKQAVEAMNEALSLGEKMDNKPYNMKDMENLLREWKDK